MRLGVSAIAEAPGTLEALGATPEATSSEIPCPREVDSINGGGEGGRGSPSRFDSVHFSERYLSSRKLSDARAKMSAVEDIDAKLEVKKLMQATVERNGVFPLPRSIIVCPDVRHHQ